MKYETIQFPMKIVQFNVKKIHICKKYENSTVFDEIQ